MMMNIQIDPKFLENKDPEEKHIPIGLLRYETQEFIKDLADVLRVDIDLVTTSVYACAASALGRKLTVIDQQEFANTPALWLCHVAPSGHGKSPVEDAVMKPLIDLHKAYYDEWKSSCAEKKGSKQENDNDKPVRKRIFLYDSTPEATYRALSQSEWGLVLYREELSGWVRDFNRYNSSGEIPNLLSIWSGKFVDTCRMTRDDEFVEDPCLNVFGGIQPKVIKKHFGLQNFTDNGFNARILWCYPKTFINPHIIRRSPRKELASRWQEFINRLIDLPPYQCTFSEEAEDLYEQFYECVSKKAVVAEEGMEEVFLKFRIQVKKWAFLTHILSEKNWMANFNETVVSGDCMQSAIDAMSCFESWARKVNDLIFPKDEKNTPAKEKVIKELNKVWPIRNQSQFAESIGVSRQYVSKVLKSSEKSEEGTPSDWLTTEMPSNALP